MSLKAMQAVWEQSASKGTARVILLALADHANEHMTAYPSLATLARYANVTRRNAIAAIERLITIGELEVVGQGRRNVNIYRIILPGKIVATGVDSDTGVDFITSVDSDTTTSVDSDTTTSVDSDTRTIKEPSYNPHYPPLASVSPPKKPLSQNGTYGKRLPDDFELTDAMRAFAEKVGVDPEWEYDAFVDYWRSVPGQKGTKRDWMAVWRNWCRKSSERKNRSSSAGLKTFAQKDRDDRVRNIRALDRLAERLQDECRPEPKNDQQKLL